MKSNLFSTRARLSRGLFTGMAGLLALLLFNPGAAAQETKHTVGLSVGSGIPIEHGLYLDFDDYTQWPDNKLTTVLGLSYEYSLTDYLAVGAHVNLEQGKADVTFPINETMKSTRLVGGLHWLTRYPNGKVHAQLGGYFNLGTMMSDEFEKSPFGFEYGLILGPAVRFDRYTAALHMMPGFSYFFSGDLPSDVLIFYPRAVIRVSYSF
jgi:hypothetical protein